MHRTNVDVSVQSGSGNLMQSSPVRRLGASGLNAWLGINDRYVPFRLHAPNEIKGSVPFISVYLWPHQ